VLLLGKTIRLLPNDDGELGAVDGDRLVPRVIDFAVNL
jgi:hypothetical protein